MTRQDHLDQLALAANQKTKERDYWLDKLSGELVKSRFPYDFNQGDLRRTEKDEPIVQVFDTRFDPRLSARLSEVGGGSDHTLHIILTAALAALLNKYTENRDIIVGTPIYRHNTEGEYINTVLPLRYRLDENTSFKDLLFQTRQVVSEAVEHQNYPIQLLADRLEIQDPSGSEDDFSLFDTAILLENIHDKDYLRPMDLHMTFSFSFAGNGRGTDTLDVAVEYNFLRYRETTVQRIISHLQHLLETMLANADTSISALEILTEDEKKQLLDTFCFVGAGYPEDKTIHGLFEEQVARNPGNIALVDTDGGEPVSYRELNEKSDRLARSLRENGVTENSIVALLLPRTPDMIAAIIAVLKAGGAYLPIDPGYPEERIDYMLTDSGAKTAVTTGTLVEEGHRVGRWDGERVLLEEGLNTEHPLHARHGNSSDPAYVIYTSGTTGKPKGVLIEHKNVVRLLFNDNFQFDFNDRDVWTLFHSYSFDFSVWEMYGALLYGGRLIVIPHEIALDTPRFLETVKKQQVTVLNQTPSAFYNFIHEALKEENSDLDLRYVIFGGEALKPGKLGEWHERYPHTRLINMFGITETTVHVTYKEIGKEEIAAGSSNIGGPIPTLGIYVMDRSRRLMPVGTAGELCVGGAGVARGYLNRPELTADRFVKNPYNPGEWLYKSGDLARVLENGDMEYLGRIDHQVQLHGFRIELGEIESQLLRDDAVKDAVVLTVGEENEISLCAYVVPTSPETFDVSTLKESLAHLLPGYMIPSYFVKLDKIPLTPNGKVDRKALPEPGGIFDRYIAPRNSLEKRLAELWARALKLEKVGVTDNYFDIGGDSIKAIRLVSLINSELNTSISIVDLYAHGTVETLAEKIADFPGIIDPEKEEQIISQITLLKDRIIKEIKSPENIEDIYPMTDIEKGIAFYYLKYIGTGLYHDQFIYPVTYRDFDIRRMEKALALMMEKHSILRTSFNIGDYEEHVHIVHNDAPLPVEYHDISDKDRSGQEAFIKECCRADRENPFNATQPPLWRMTFFSIDKDHIIVLFVFHHAVLDGWSAASLVTEANDIYLRLETGPGFRPEPLSADYKDAVISEILEKQNTESIEYWKKELSGYNRLDIFETVKNDVTAENMRMFRHSLGREALAGLRKTARENNTSVKNLCFAAYVYIMNMLSNEEDVVVGNVSNNRPIIEDGENILGCFLNTVPVRVNIPYGKSWTHYIRMIEEKILDLRKYERMPLFEIARVIGEKSTDKNPFFDTLFNFKDFHVLQQIETGDKKVDTAAKPSLSIPRGEDTNTLFDFEVDITTDSLLLEPKYRPLALDHSTVEKCCIYFERVLDKFMNEPDSVMSKQEIITEEEKQALLYEFNDTAAPYSREKTMHQLFEEQVSRSPEAVALIDRDGSMKWTYEELNNRSNQLAGFLRKRGVKPGGLIAVVMDRSVHMVAAVMGILKAGGAYVPLEPYLPDQRIRKILDSLNIETLVTNEAQLLKIDRISRELPLLTHIISLDKRPGVDGGLFEGKELSGPEAVEREGINNLPPAARSGDIAYVIFTSGSTGTPKGVVETHRPVINVVEWVNKTFEVGYPDKLLFVASLSFDLSVYDVFGILASGGCLRVVESEDIKDPGTLLDIIMNEGITFWDSAPAALQQLVPFFHEVGGYAVPSRLRLVFLSGDWIPVTMPDALRETFPGVRVISLGGATEATIWSNYYPIGEVDTSWPSIPYGKPIQNAKYYILDRNLDVCPLRVPGDLFIGGECLAEEYINDTQLSAFKFIANPFVPGEKIYRTGDMARWFEDGNMQFLGRKDHQVKIRGYRIELGEIESQLLNHPEVSDGIVLDRLDAGGTKYLCAYYVCKRKGEELDRDELKQFLSLELPEYMLPGYFIAIDEIPLTANGKLDRKALPEPEAGVSSDVDYTPPGTVTQERLVVIWSQVLGMDPESIGIGADFFELGGHSLNATMVISRIHKELNVKVPLLEIFNRPTILELSSIVDTLEGGFYMAVEPVEKKEYYYLSSAQRRLHFLQQMEPDNIGYNIQEGVVFEGVPDLSLLETTFRQLIDRHESLRTYFDTVNGEMVQRILGDVPFEIECYDDGSAESQARFIRPFDLSRAPLLRVGLFRLLGDRHILLTDMHHIISDGTSQAVLKGDFGILYSGGRLPAIPLQYKDYSEWRNSEKQQEIVGRQKSFWLNELSGEIPVLDIPTDYPRPAIQSYEGKTVEFDIDRDTTALLNQLGRDEKATLYMVLTAIYNVLLYKLSSQDEIIIGTPTAGRPHSDLERIIGMFVNTLALKNYPSGEKTFSGFLKEVKDRTIRAFENQDYQFEELVEHLEVKRDASRNPVFDVMIVLQNMEVETQGTPGIGEPGVGEKPSGLAMQSYQYTADISKFDLTLTGIEGDDGIHFILEYCTRLFKEETIKRMVEYFKRIVSAVTAAPGMGISEISILSEEEKHRLLFEFNATNARFVGEKTLHRLFEEQVEQMPHGAALVFGDHCLTYRELNRKANQLARNLRMRGVGADDVVGLMVERSLEMVVGMVGIMKAGGAYLPVDPEFPAERKKYMLEDSSVRILLYNFHREKITGDVPGEIETLDLRDENIYCGESKNPRHINNASHLAYLIYTSGSTGRPKGVMLEHRNLVNLLLYGFEYTNLDFSTVLQFSTISFDASFHEIFSVLLSGGKLCLIDKEIRTDIPALFETIDKNKIRTLFLPISLLKIIFSVENYTAVFPRCVRHIQTAGEQVVISDTFRNHLKENNIYLHNHYGPSEAHVVTALTLDPQGDIPHLPSIGKPVSNTAIYILDKYGNPQPIGIQGELYIGGIQVGRGYLGRQELTAEKFITNPFVKGDRLYKTGDIAKWLPDGNIDFLGRLDHQVKIRGFRIEPGEVEYQLSNHEAIHEAVVLVKESPGGEKYLCAYIVPESEGQTPEIPGLIEDLSKVLPDYMIPGRFIPVDTIPLTPIGKIDRRALPDPEIKPGESYAAPTDEIEKKLAKIWTEVLFPGESATSQAVVGIDDNFFQLGGHSLKATIITAKIDKELNVKLPLAEIFRTPTVRGMAKAIKKMDTGKYASIELSEKKEYYPLSSAQRRLFVLQQMGENNLAYNMTQVFPLPKNIDKEKLVTVFNRLIARHETLRTSFEVVEGEPVQKVHKNVELNLQLYKTDEAGWDSVGRNFTRPFDLSEAPLLRVGLVEIESPSSYYYLLVEMHHIISDEVSQNLLQEEFLTLSGGRELPPLKIQYKDFAEWENCSVRQEAVKKQEAYWLKQFDDEVPVLNLPLDFPRPAVQSNEGCTVSFHLPLEDSTALRTVARQEGATMFMVLLTVYNIFLAKLCNQEEIIVGTPVAGRKHSDLERIIGVFINSLALRSFPGREKTVREFLNEVKTDTLEAIENQEYPFDDLVENVTAVRETGRNPLFDVMLNLLNQEDFVNAIPDDHNGDSYTHVKERVRFDMNLVTVDSGDRVFCIFFYCTALFKPETIDRFLEYFNEIISQLPVSLDRKIGDIEVISEAERQQLLYEFNAYESDYPREKTAVQLFEEQVKRTPDGVALVFEDNRLTYRQLNEQANRLGGLLRDKGVRPDTLVGLMVQRSVEMVVGIWGILKSGGAYLPVNPEAPEDRVAYMLDNASVTVLLTQEKFIEKFSARYRVINLNSPASYKGPGADPGCRNTPTDLAYVIYTSGSTGKPKGVMIRNRSVINIVKWFAAQYDLKPGFQLLQMFEYTFDASINQIFGSLLHGVTLHVIRKEYFYDIDFLRDYIIDNFINLINFVQSVIKEVLCGKEKIESLKHVISGAEKLKSTVKNEILDHGYTLYNQYGPTEVTVDALAEKCSYESNGTVGVPVYNAQCYIVNTSGRLNPVGVAGELWVSGDGLARGYINNVDLTVEKFIPNPFNPGTRVYKTGDLTRWMPAGNVEFLGRIDSQIKIRGFRIEPVEIAGQLVKIDGITEAVVIDREDDSGDTYLCAYLVGTQEIGTVEIKRILGNSLPDYMVPSTFVWIDQLPLSGHGKLIRSALPEPDSASRSTEAYAAPQNQLEEKLVEIWSGVLNVAPETIGVNSDFFELGGHSLKATILTSRVHKELNVRLPLVKIFAAPTVRKLAMYINQLEKDTFISIPAVEKRDVYPLSSAQERLYVLQQVDLNSIAYNLPYGVPLHGEIEADKLENVFRKLIRRHESLRTSFHMQDETPVQEIHDDVEFSINYRKKTGEKESTHPELIHEFTRPFDLSKAPLLRVELVGMGTGEHLLLLDMHHIITDGISQGLLVKEFTALSAGESLEPLRIQYKDYALWQRVEKERGRVKEQETYWVNEFQGGCPVLSLPVDFPRPVVQSFEGNVIAFALGDEETAGLLELAADWGCTIYMMLLGIYNVLLAKLTGQEDIVVGTPVAGRPHAELQNIMGMFVNTLALRNYPSLSKRFIDFINEIKERTLRAFDNQEYQFEDLVDKISVRRDASRNPLFDVLFVLQNARNDGEETRGMSVTQLEQGTGISKFDMTLTGIEAGDSLFLSLEYCTKLFKEETIRRFADYFKRIVPLILENPSVRLAEIDILCEEEKNRLLFDFNRTDAAYPKDKTIHRFFEEQAAKMPDNTAVVVSLSPLFLTYGELNRRAHRLAGTLRDRGIKKGAVAAVKLERSIEMVVSILAILKTGAAYLPIEPFYPEERIKYILEDSGVKLLLSRESRAGNSAGDYEIIDPGDECIYIYDRNEHRYEDGLDTSTSPAYVIYTSGSTGNPKGVLVGHAAVVNLLWGLYLRYPFTGNDVYMLKTSYIFDVSVTEIFGWFFGGGRLALLEKDGEKYPDAIVGAVERDEVTHINFVPSMFNVLVHHLTQQNIGGLRKLKYIFLAGEALLPELVKKFEALNCDILLENLYGPTEAAVYASGYSLSDWSGIGGVPIGKPLSNVRLYILDKSNNLTPMGVPGELNISGDGVAMGYLNRPELTAERFDRSYKTGDLVRRLPDGNIEFLGRIDHQVKVRGFRIEPGEIENRLLGHSDVRAALVMDREGIGGDRYLCAYVVPHTKENFRESELREYLGKYLPDYMVPAYFVVLEEIPLTPGGKIDRKALPVPEVKIEDNYAPPRNETEEKLVEMWSGLLNVDKEVIGIHSNFFEIGGHSLKATVLVSLIHKEFNVKVPLAKIFVNSTVKALSEYILESVEDRYEDIEPVEKREYYALSSAQRRIYLLQQLAPESTVYNIFHAIPLPSGFDLQQLERTFVRLIDRHESLRTSFELIAGEPVQKIHTGVEFGIETHERPQDGEGEIIRPFDLSRAPLMRVGVIKTGESAHSLVVDLHHIVSDGISHEILEREFLDFYQGVERFPLNIQYKDFAHWQSNEKQEAYLKRQEAYWIGLFEDEVPELNLPTDFPRPRVLSFEGGMVLDEISCDIDVLKTIGLKNGATPFMVMLTIFNIFLSRVTGQEDIVVGTPTAGRNHAALQDVVGMFVNTLVLRSRPGSEKTFLGFLREVRDNTLEAFNNQDYQFEELVEKVSINRDTARNPLFDVMFVMQNAQGASLLGEGIIGPGSDGVEMEPFEYGNPSSKFDLSLFTNEVGNRLHFTFQYSTGLFKKETILRFIAYLKTIVTAVVSEPDVKLGQIDIVSEDEKRCLLYDFNDTASGYPKDKTIHRLFEEQAERTGGRIAVIGPEGTGNQQVTYRELNERADRLACFLKEKGVSPDTIVGIMMERSVEMIIGIMGILKSGGAYLPINPDYPETRIDYMLNDSNAAILLTYDLLMESLIQEKPLESLKNANALSPRTQPHNLAYVIYTSGSTGRPKGVMVQHRSFMNACAWQISYYNITKNDRATQYAPFVFDASLLEIFPCLLQGASLYIIAEKIKLDTHRLNHYYEKMNITFSFLPSQFSELFMELENRSLRVLLAAGDILRKYVKRNYRLYNNYGPTENSVVTTSMLVENQSQNIPIGAPIHNNHVYVLDKNRLRMEPIGVPGELCIGGESLSRGYLNHPELTAEKFIQLQKNVTPFPVDRLYRTGDLARWLPGGNIEFLGRADQQVKIRGFRVEPGEIENRLLKHEAVKQAVVLVKDGRLYAYITAEKELTASHLRGHLSGELPDYMIPSHLVQMEKIPLTPNGKVDVKNLGLSGKSLETGTAYAPPQNEIERQIADTWEQVLDRDNVGIHDNYFDLGGNSFDILKINAKLKEHFQMDIPVVAMFTYPTVQSFAEYIINKQQEKAEEIRDRSAVLERSRVDRREQFRRRKGGGK